jgi:hypothetical protein
MPEKTYSFQAFITFVSEIIYHEIPMTSPSFEILGFCCARRESGKRPKAQKDSFKSLSHQGTRTRTKNPGLIDSDV